MPGALPPRLLFISRSLVEIGRQYRGVAVPWACQARRHERGRATLGVTAVVHFSIIPALH